MTKTTIQNLVSQAIDLHVHIGPEIIPRKFNSASALLEAEKGKIAGMALKNHFYSTQPFIAEVDKSEMTLIGSVVLNNFQGGLNPEAIYANSLISTLPTIVWLPTISAAQFLAESKYEIAPEWVRKNDFIARKAQNIKPVVIDYKIEPVLQMIKDTNAILATGHISWQETLSVIRKAAKLGLKKLIVTHPIYQRINFPLDQQIKLTKLGAKMEHCYSMYSIDEIPINRIAEQIKAVGAKNCILSSDVGQTFSPPPSEALAIFAESLLEEGLTLAELEVMMIINPRKLIDL